jgi:hypothetical protein
VEVLVPGSPVVVSTLATLLLAACSADAPLTGPEARPRLSASTTVKQWRFDLTNTRVSGCSGDVFYLTGTLHYLFRTTVNQNRVSLDGHINESNFKGVAADGTEYVTTFASNDVFNYDIPDGGPREFTYDVHTNLISRGSEENVTFAFVMHYTVSATGELSAVVESIVAKCTG